MTKNINNINSHSSITNMLQTVESNKIKTYFNQNKNSKLLVLSLDDLNADLLNQLKAKQCRMMLLGENFTIVEETKPKQIAPIQLTIDGCRQTMSAENIIRLEACGNYTKMFLQNYAKPVLTSRTLKFYANLLDKEMFVRPHQSHLVNRLFIDRLVLKPKPFLVLKTGTQVSIARRKVSSFRKLRIG